MTEPQQINIPFVVDTQMTRENFFPSASNADMVQLIHDWPQWSGPIAIVTGPVGSGKSHSAHAWADIADATLWSRDDLAAWTPEQVLSSTIAIDGLGPSLGEALEVKLFHLINALKSLNGFLLITSNASLPEWNIALPDLKSRLQTAVQVSLKAPDDALLSAVITKLFSDRQMEIAQQNVQYLVTHMDRSLANARAIVAHIDQESLRRKSKITRNIIADILAEAQSN